MLLSDTTETGRVHGPNWTKYLGHLARKPRVTGLEIGTFRGESAKWMVEHIFTNELSRYYCVDPFTGSAEHQEMGLDFSLIESIARDALSPHTNCWIDKARSHDFLPKLIFSGVKLDFVYVDGSHQAGDVLFDSFLAFQLLKIGGILCWDDYHWKVFTDKNNCPQFGIDVFLDLWGEKLTVLHKGPQVFIRKEKD